MQKNISSNSKDVCNSREAAVAIAVAHETILGTQGTEGCQQQYPISRRHTINSGDATNNITSNKRISATVGSPATPVTPARAKVLAKVGKSTRAETPVTARLVCTKDAIATAGT